MSIGKTLRHGAFLFGALLLAPSAHADPITYSFGGHLFAADLFTGSTNSAWDFAAGQAFRGTLVYDVDAITQTTTYSDTPTTTTKRYTSPIVAMSFQIDRASGTYSYDVPLAWASALVFRDADPTYPGYGASLDMMNYTWDGTPIVPVPAAAMVGSYNPHSTFLGFSTPDPVLASADPDVDFVSLFNATPDIGRLFSVRFSDPVNWQVGVEHIDGVVYGRIEQFAVQSAVPEPATWLMLIGGAGISGAAVRRRRSVHA